MSVSVRFYLCAGYSHYDQQFAQRLLLEAVLTGCRARRNLPECNRTVLYTAVRVAVFTRKSGCLAEDYGGPLDIAVDSPPVIRSDADNGEFSHMSMDAAIRIMDVSVITKRQLRPKPDKPHPKRSSNGVC